MEAINAYDGPGFVNGAAPGQRRKTSQQAIREAHRGLMDALERNGKMALNASDFESTMHLPVGRGRLACDDEGEFDKTAPRPAYNPRTAPRFPMHLHSTVTVGEHVEVKNEEEMAAKLATRMWAIKPIEIVKRFKLTETDQMLSLQAEIQGERAARLSLERQMGVNPNGVLIGKDEADNLLSIQVAQLKEENRLMAERFDKLMAIWEGDKADEVLTPADSDSTDDEEYVAPKSGKSRK